MVKILSKPYLYAKSLIPQKTGKLVNCLGRFCGNSLFEQTDFNHGVCPKCDAENKKEFAEIETFSEARYGCM